MAYYCLGFGIFVVSGILLLWFPVLIKVVDRGTKGFDRMMLESQSTEATNEPVQEGPALRGPAGFGFLN